MVSPQTSIQCKDKEIAQRLEVVEFLRMDVSPARLHGEILLRPDRVADRGTLERLTSKANFDQFDALAVPLASW